MNTYTRETDRKFYKDLQIRYFPGNTVICFLEPGSPVYKLANWCLSRLLNLSFSAKYSILPPASFHMTVFDLIAGGQNLPEQLGKRLGPDASIKKSDEYFEEQIPRIEKPEEMHMKYRGIYMDSYFTICLEPATDHAAYGIMQYRKALSTVTGIPLNEKYGFHISLAYLIINLNEKEKKECERNIKVMQERLENDLDPFVLPAPRLVFFDTMYAFYKNKNLTYRWFIRG